MKTFHYLILTLLLSSFLASAQSYTITPNSSVQNSSVSSPTTYIGTSSFLGITGIRANGTLATLTPVINNDLLFSLKAGGYWAPGSYSDQASLRFSATQNWSSSANGSKINFFTTANGTFIQQERMVIQHDGKLGIGLSSPQSLLHIHNPAAAAGANLQITNQDVGNTTADGLVLGINPSGLFFGLGGYLLNRENSFISLGTNNVPEFAIWPGGKSVLGGASGLLPTESQLAIYSNSACCGGTTSAQLELHETENTDGARLRFKNGASTTNARFWDAFALPSNNAASAQFSIYHATADGVGQNVLNLTGNGNATVTNYTSLGADAPKIRMKKYTGTTAAAEGGEVSVLHGLDIAKILDIRLIIQATTILSGFAIPGGFNKDNTYEGTVYATGTNIVVGNKTANSSSILSKPFTVLVTYEE